MVPPPPSDTLWHRGGTIVAGWWHHRGRVVAPSWQGGGTIVAPSWHPVIRTRELTRLEVSRPCQRCQLRRNCCLLIPRPTTPARRPIQPGAPSRRLAANPQRSPREVGRHPPTGSCFPSDRLACEGIAPPQATSREALKRSDSISHSAHWRPRLSRTGSGPGRSRCWGWSNADRRCGRSGRGRGTGPRRRKPGFRGTIRAQVTSA